MMAIKSTDLMCLSVQDLERIRCEFQENYDLIFKDLPEIYRRTMVIKLINIDCKGDLPQYEKLQADNILSMNENFFNVDE